MAAKKVHKRCLRRYTRICPDPSLPSPSIGDWNERTAKTVA